MQNHYHRLRADEMHRRGLLNHMCGYAIEPMLKETRVNHERVEKLKCMCSLTEKKCIYWGHQTDKVKQTVEYHSCPVYQKLEAVWLRRATT